MNPSFECAVTASFLRSGRVLSNASNCAALIAAAGTLLTHTLAARLSFAASFLCWPLACYFSLRVAIDASLFRDLGGAAADGGAALDDLLRTWGLARGKGGRTIAERGRGALKLWHRLIASVAAQLAAMVAGILIQAWVA
jgi:hypothetical protein